MASSFKRTLAAILSAVLLISVIGMSGIVATAAKTNEDIPVGTTLKFDFGTPESDIEEGYTAITVGNEYSEAIGYGWIPQEGVNLTAFDADSNDALKGDYIAGNNVRGSGTNPTYTYPTFAVDLPVGFYSVRVVQGSALESSVCGAYFEDSMSSIKWFNGDWGTDYNEPTQDKWIVNQAGTYADNTREVAVYDGQLTISVATSLTTAGASGVAYINALEITRLPDPTPATAPTVRFIGDSTVATYPPYDHPEYAPIPEQTGWGSDFAMKPFFTSDVVLVNRAIGGISARNFIYNDKLNSFLLESHPGDTVVIEWGINESAAGRRYIAQGNEYIAYMNKYINACKAFGLDVVLVTGTKASSSYAGNIKSAASAAGIPCIDLLTLNNSYSGNSATNSGYLTVDGTHPSRVGGLVCAQIVTNELKALNLPISQYIPGKALNYAKPTVTVENLRILKQNSKAVTLTWDLALSDLYDSNQLVRLFNVYRKVAGAADSTYTKVAEGTAYVSPDMTEPKQSVTAITKDEQTYEYAVSVVGVTGEGPKSAPITVANYVPTPAEELNNLLASATSLRNTMTHFTWEDACKINKAYLAAVSLPKTASAEEITAAYNNLKNALDGATRTMSTVMWEDFEAASGTWGTGGNKLCSIVTDDEGNKMLNVYVSAAGTRNTTKSISSVSTTKELVQFQWKPGHPDQRNVTELRFYYGGTKLMFSLKTSNNGHIGYVPNGQTPATNGDGFHSGAAVDLRIPNNIWYNVSMLFDYENHTVDIELNSVDKKYAVVVNDAAIPAAATSLTQINFYGERGKNDTGGNDLSILWDSYMDNLGIYYVPAGTTAPNTAAANAALAMINAVEPSAYTPESYAAFNADIAEFITLPFFTWDNATQADYDYYVARANAALALLVEAGEASSEVEAGEFAVNAPFELTATLPSSVVKPYFVSETGTPLAAERTAIDNGDGTKTWTLKMSLGTMGARELKLFADGEDTGITYKFDIVQAVAKDGDAELISVFAPLGLKVNEAFTVTFQTTTAVTNVRLFNESGAGLAPSACSYEDAGGVRFWSYTIAVGTAGQRSFTAKIADASGVYSGNDLVNLYVAPNLR